MELMPMDSTSVAVCAITAAVGVGVITWGYVMNGDVSILQDKIKRLWDASLVSKGRHAEQKEKIESLEHRFDSMVDATKVSMDNLMDAQKSMLSALEETHGEFTAVRVRVEELEPKVVDILANIEKITTDKWDAKRVQENLLEHMRKSYHKNEELEARLGAQKKIMDDLLIALDAFSFAGARNSRDGPKYSTLRARVGELRKQLEAPVVVVAN
jgi:chromosome segregation ATPase